MQSNNQAQGNLLDVGEIIKRIPFTNRLIFVIVLSLWALSFFTPSNLFLVNLVQLTWSENSHQIWRIFTSSFCINSIFLIILVAVNCYTFLPKLENNISSITLLLQFVIIGSLIQFLFLLLMKLIPKSLYGYISQGNFYGIWFNLIFKYCYFNNSNKIKFCCFPFKISKIAYPFAFLAVLSILKFQLILDSVIGIILAFIECKFLNGNLFLCKFDLCFSFLSSLDCWVSAGSAQGGYEGLQQQVQVPRWSKSTKATNDQDYFKNKKGVAIG